MRQVALQQRLKGKKSAQDGVVKVAPGQYVQLDREGTDKIFAVLVEFGDNQYREPESGSSARRRTAAPPTSPVRCTTRSRSRTAASTTPRCGSPTTTATHYEDMYFNRMAAYYETQSSGRYSVEGAVTEWVKVPFNEALYGRNYCGSIVCNTSKALVRDALAVWVESKLHPARARPGRCRRSRPTSRPSTSRTATASTVTTTSTSPTASSTTSRSCTRAATRRPVTRTRARTPSGATAQPRTSRPAARSAPVSTSAPTAAS